MGTKDLRVMLAALSGLLIALWLGTYAFHLWPVGGIMDQNWWDLPWAFTVVFVSACAGAVCARAVFWVSRFVVC